MRAVIFFASLLYAMEGYAVTPFLYLPSKIQKITCDFCCYKSKKTEKCHNAIDYGTPSKTEILAAAAGEVVFVRDGQPENKPGVVVKNWSDYGNYVKIKSPVNQYVTLYAHLSPNTIEVQVGQQVNAGQLIGLSDHTGYSSGPHLHFEVRDPSGKKVNPYGENPKYPNCGKNALWVKCPPEPVPVDNDGDGFLSGIDCNDANPAVNPNAKELCDSIDNDCDGKTDEDWKKGAQKVLGKPCTAGVGACVATGTWQCAANGIMVTCGAPAPQSTPELCDGIDNDCDGKTDEEWPLLNKECVVGVGQCEGAGWWNCAPNGAGIVCDANYVTPNEEVCDGLDNDCDGDVDEEWPDIGAICLIPTEKEYEYPSFGAITCSSSQDTTECTPIPGGLAPEKCFDGVDNDGDGITDEPCPPCSGCCFDCYQACNWKAVCYSIMAGIDMVFEIYYQCLWVDKCTTMYTYNCLGCICNSMCEELYTVPSSCPPECLLVE